MPSFPLRTIDCTDLVLVPWNESDFLAEVRRVANPRQLRSMVIDIEKSTISIRHKLSVAMYQAALISRVNADHFSDFEKLALASQRPTQPSRVEYKGSLYDMEDIEHYRLFITSFVEYFAATNFSLLDVSGYLINSLYDLGRNEERTSFQKAFQDLHARKQNNPDAVYNLLLRHILRIDQHNPPNSNAVSWLSPLKMIRNRTTHRPVTDVCHAHTSHRRGLYAEFRNEVTDFMLNPDLFPSNTPDVKLGDFVREVFEGMQEFVEDLYENLKQAVISTGSLPLS